MSLHAKIALSDLQRYPWNLNLIKILEDTVVILTQQVFLKSNLLFANLASRCSSIKFLILSTNREIKLSFCLFFGYSELSSIILKSKYLSNCMLSDKILEREKKWLLCLLTKISPRIPCLSNIWIIGWFGIYKINIFDL